MGLPSQILLCGGKRIGDGSRIIALFMGKLMKPTPIRCIHDFCMNCKQQNEWAVANCENESCFLYPVRPNQGLQGKSQDDYDLDELEQQVLDNLNFKGLKEIFNERSA